MSILRTSVRLRTRLQLVRQCRSDLSVYESIAVHDSPKETSPYGFNVGSSLLKSAGDFTRSLLRSPLTSHSPFRSVRFIAVKGVSADEHPLGLQDFFC